MSPLSFQCYSWWWWWECRGVPPKVISKRVQLLVVATAPDSQLFEILLVSRLVTVLKLSVMSSVNFELDRGVSIDVQSLVYMEKSSGESTHGCWMRITIRSIAHPQTSMRVPSETFRYWNNFACPQTSKMASGQKYRYWTSFACPEDVQEGSLSDVQILNQFCMSRRRPRGVRIRHSNIEPVLHVHGRPRGSLVRRSDIEPVLHIHRRPRGSLVRRSDIKPVLHVHRRTKEVPIRRSDIEPDLHVQ